MLTFSFALEEGKEKWKWRGFVKAKLIVFSIYCSSFTPSGCLDVKLKVTPIKHITQLFPRGYCCWVQFSRGEAHRKPPSCSRDQQEVSVLGRTVKPQHCPAVYQYLWLPLQPCSASFLHSHELGSPEFWDREDNSSSGTRNPSPLK